jgi:Ca-activated chloride channel family protein
MNLRFEFSILFLLVVMSGQTNANVWDDLWKTHDQQASKAFVEQDFDKAAELFENNQWQGASSYKKGDFDAAKLQFSKRNDVESKYNKGNSLAKAQQFQQAIDSYNQVLEESPNHEDALFNKKIVEEMLKQQQQQKEKQDQEKKDQENKDKQESESESDSKSEQESDEESEEKKNSEQQEPEQQSEKESEQQTEEKQAQLSEDQRDQHEKDQALEHWLEKIPDDPGGLLRRKMYREYQRRGRQQKEKKIW